MSKRLKKRSTKAGLPPGTLVYIGDGQKETSTIDVIRFGPLDFEENRIAVDDCATYCNKKGVSWINIDGIGDFTVLEKVGKTFHLHALTLEDIVNTDQRPKMEEYGKYLFIVMKMLRFDAASSEILSEQVSVVLTASAVITFQEGIAGDVLDPIRERLRSAKGKTRSLGADYLCYSMIDAVVDNYFIILENIGEQIEDLEEDLLANPVPETFHRIHHLKRELILLRKSLWPLREVIGMMQRDETDLITKPTGVYLRDVYDHTIQVIDTLETYRDMLTGMIDLYMSSVSNKMNEIMKVLTIFSTVFMPLTFIAGVYGMNFKYMPELSMTWTYPALWGIMISISIGMYFFFKRKKWI